MKGGMTMIPASILTVVTAVVCKKVLDIVFDEPPSKAPYDSIKNHDTLCEDIVEEVINKILDAANETGTVEQTALF